MLAMFFLLQEESAALSDDLESQAVLGLWMEQCGGDSPAGGEDDREDGQPLCWGQHGPVEEGSSGAGQADGQRGVGAEGQ